MSSVKSPNLATIVKKEVVTPSTASSSDAGEPPALAKIKQEPVTPRSSVNITDDLKIKTSNSNVNTPNRGTEVTSLNLSGTPTDRLQEAADKITLMSPEAFSSPMSHPTIKIKKEPLSPSNQSHVSSENHRSEAVTSNSISTLAGSLNLMNMASAGSSPSREVQDILAESEEQGGITADIVITEEPETDEVDDEEEDEDEYKSPLDGDDDEDPLYDEDEEFKGKLEEYNPENIMSNHKQPSGVQAQSSTELAGLLNMIKKEKKPDETEITIKTEPGLKYEEPQHSTTNNTTGGNSSAWLSIVPKQELMEPKPTKSIPVGVDPLVSPLSALMSGNSNINRSFEISKDSLNGAMGSPSIINAPMLYPLQQLQSTQNDLLLNIQQQMEHMSKTMGSMASLIQTQRAEVQVCFRYRIYSFNIA
jgi:hypothetical protein